jgi:hypothetical protein
MRYLARLGFLASLLVACGGSSDGSSDSSPSAEVTAGGSGGASADAGSVGAGDGGGGGAATGDTWSTFAQTFFDSYCVECHGADSATRDYTLLDQVIRDADEIRCGVAVDKIDGCPDFPPPQQFPIGNGAMPSDEERDRLVAWIEAGTAE